MRYVLRLLLAVFLIGLGFSVVHAADLPFLIPAHLASPTAHAPILTTHFAVRVHPDGPLYVGDRISFEVFSPPNLDLSGQDLETVNVEINRPVRQTLGEAKFSKDQATDQYKASLQWVWDTSGLAPGPYTLTFRASPQGFEWKEEIILLPAASIPPQNAQATWASTQTDCCIIHYVTGTAAERDIEMLKQMAEEEAASTASAFQTKLDEPIAITFIPRVLGHGGFATDEVFVSYLDRNYAGSTTRLVLHHELVHLVDGRLGGEFRPSMFIEGLAVYLSGGHFKPEPLIERAAVLPMIDEYIPLSELANNFYIHQHEAGYLEAGALVEYMVNTWGWDEFQAFYRGMKKPEDGGDSQAIDAALQEHFGVTFQELESRFQERLENTPDKERWIDDVRLTIQFYDTVRRYQQVFDPSAYFRELWLPDPKEMRERGIVADFLRHPDHPANRVLETLLVNADFNLRAGDYPEVESFLSKVNEALDVQEHLLVYRDFSEKIREPVTENP